MSRLDVITNTIIRVLTTITTTNSVYGIRKEVDLVAGGIIEVEGLHSGYVISSL